jgi:tetratricopeptide (TPR) repeat protein
MKMRSSILTMLFGLVLGTSLLVPGLLGQEGPRPKTQKEAEAINKMFQAPTPDGRIAAANDLITNFADTQFKGLAYQIMAQAAEDKMDWDKAIVYSEFAIKADANDYISHNIVGRGYAETTKEHDFDREDKLKKAEQFAQKAIDLATNAKNPNPQLPEDQFQAFKKDEMAKGHETLGMADLIRKKLDSGITKMKTAASMTSNPRLQARLAQTLIANNKADEGIAIFEKMAQSTDPTVAGYAKGQLEKAKAAAPKK